MIMGERVTAWNLKNDGLQVRFISESPPGLKSRMVMCGPHWKGSKNTRTGLVHWDDSKKKSFITGVITWIPPSMK